MNEELLHRGLDAVVQNADSYIIAVFSGKCSYCTIEGNHAQLLTMKAIIDNDTKIAEALLDEEDGE